MKGHNLLKIWEFYEIDSSLPRQLLPYGMLSVGIGNFLAEISSSESEEYQTIVLHFRISPRFYNLNLIQPYHRGVPSNLGSILKRRVFSKIIGFERTWMGQNTCNFITEFGVIFIFAKIEGCGQKNIREIKILFDNSFYSRMASSHRLQSTTLL